MSGPSVDSTIDVRLVLFADLRRILPPGHDGQFVISVPAGATVADLVTASGLTFRPGEERELRVGVNGESSRMDAPLQGGDEVVLFSPMEGG